MLVSCDCDRLLTLWLFVSSSTKSPAHDCKRIETGKRPFEYAL